MCKAIILLSLLFGKNVKKSLVIEKTSYKYGLVKA
jgi:hypothetical protein